MNKIKIISILATLLSVSVNGSDLFGPPGVVTPLPSFQTPSSTFTMPRAHVYTAPVAVYRPVAVSSYTTTAGTYVAPHYRSAPNGTQTDNYSAKGFVNPFTGVAGTRTPSK